MEDAVKEAYETGRTGTEADRFQVGAKLLKDGVNIELTYGYDAEMLRELLEKTLLPEKKAEDKKPGFWRAITK